ncbi:hypothetical protein HK101_007218 [Irineochytrium annulatum]|nr:hypothetical protein HK101_007218 [Irineochytrium annulatum]
MTFNLRLDPDALAYLQGPGIPPLILGSSSSSRASVLRAANLPFTVVRADVDEKLLGGDRATRDPNDLVITLARCKIDAILKEGKVAGLKEGILIGCDQVAVFDGKIREKPESEAEARMFLASYANHYAETRGGMVVVNLATGKRAEAIDVAKQHFNAVPASVIDKLIAQGTVYHCCGGFMIDDPLLVPCCGETVGDQDSIIGLSLRLLSKLIKEVL